MVSPTPMDTVINGSRDLPTYRFDGSNHSQHQLSPWDGIKYYLKSRGAYHNDTSKIEMPGYHWIGSKAMGSYYHLSDNDTDTNTISISKYSAKGVDLWKKQFQI